MQKEVSALISLSPSLFFFSLSLPATIHIKTQRERCRKEGADGRERERLQRKGDISSCCRLIIKIFNSCVSVHRLCSQLNKDAGRKEEKNQFIWVSPLSDPQEY